MNNLSNHEESPSLAGKIARLVEERGWTQEEFARQANINRLTARRILQEDNPSIQSKTISSCARAVGVTVHDLRNMPLDKLIARVNLHHRAGSDQTLRILYEQATQPELLAWIDRNPDRANLLNAAELDELLSLQGTGGPLTSFGVERAIELIERKRKLKEQVETIAGTEYLEMLETLVELIYDKIQPYRDRGKIGE